MKKRLQNFAVALAVLASGGAVSVLADTVSYTATVMTPSPADVVDITYDLGAGPATAAVYAGQINWTVTQSTVPGLAVGSTFGSFCVDLAHDIYVGNSYQYSPTLDLSQLGGLSALPPAEANTVIGELGTLFADDYSAAVTPGNNDGAASFQMAIWKLVYGDAAIGFAAGSNPDLAAATAADISHAQSSSKPFLLTGLASVNNTPASQDQIMPTSVLPGVASVVPLPKATSQTTVLGVLAVLGWAAGRLRKTAVPAVVRV